MLPTSTSTANVLLECNDKSYAVLNVWGLKKYIVCLVKHEKIAILSQEFGRFFHKQLASILQDSLSKFEDKK